MKLNIDTAPVWMLMILTITVNIFGWGILFGVVLAARIIAEIL